MTNFQVPTSLDAAIADLNGLGALLTAKQWQRAAIVYAFTEATEGRPPKTAGNPAVMTLSAFANLGIAGLRDRETVAWVREAWEDAMQDSQTVAARPGDTVSLPEREFPKHPRTRTTFDGFRTQLRNRPDAIRELVRDEPEIAAQLARQIVDTPAVRHAVEARLAEPIRDREVFERERVEPTPDYNDEAIRHINGLLPSLRANQRGEWQPSPAVLMLFHAVGLLLQEIRPESQPADDLFTDIERYLKEGVA